MRRQFDVSAGRRELDHREQIPDHLLQAGGVALRRQSSGVQPQ